MIERCPCGSGGTFSTCCGPILAGAPAPHPEALMRSRYTAYVRRDFVHVRRTWAPETRHAFDVPEAARDAAGTEWLGLEVHDATAEGDAGTVSFTARFRREGRTLALAERSRFRRQDGWWLYVDGHASLAAVRPAAKVGRNAPCPCGSGRKHKACCGA